jgi:endonuclease-3 related protein
LPAADLAELIRPAGYFNIKTRRLKSFLEVLFVRCRGRLETLFAGETATVRERLLAINGIGPETADSLLLYAGDHLSFVVDAYTKRILSRHGWCAPEASYDAIQAILVSALSQKPRRQLLDYWRDYHAQLVIVGKRYCRKNEVRCADCPLQSLLP